MTKPTTRKPHPSPTRYEPPRLVRVAVSTARAAIGHQYAGDITCTRHNHDDPGAGTNGCTFPQ